MQIQPILTPVVTASTPSAATSAPAVTVQGGAAILDSVTLSAGALALLNGGAPAPVSGSAGIWGSDAMKRALADLNDMSGKTAVADQISSFRMIHSMIADSTNFDTDAKRAEASPVTAAFLDSPYAKHLQDVFTRIQSHMQTSSSGASPESMERMLGAFNALSSDDQQTALAANNVYYRSIGQSVGQEDPFASVDAYRANLTAHIGMVRELRTAMADPAYAPKLQEELDRPLIPGVSYSDDFHRKLDALSAAAAAAGDQRIVDLVSLQSIHGMNDSWTASVEAHFATYGPPPATAPSDGPINWTWPTGRAGSMQPASGDLAKALSLINDNSGKTSLVDQARAFDTVYNHAGSMAMGPVQMALHKNIENSGIFNKLWAAEARFGRAQLDVERQYYDRADRGDSFSQDEMILKAYNKVSRSDQEFIFAMYGSRLEYSDSNPGGKVIRYATLDEYKADLQRRVDESAPVYERVNQAKSMARAEAGNADVRDKRFTLAWMNKLSTDDQKFILHTELHGSSWLTRSISDVPDWMRPHQSLDDYKADLKRKADAEAREAAKPSSTAKASTKEKSGKSLTATAWKDKLGRNFMSPASLNASIALQMLQATEASRRSALNEHAWGWAYQSRITPR
jgi:hypothetical protein